MRYGAFGLVLFAAVQLCLSCKPAAQHADHIMLDPSELVWKDLPSLPGVKIAVIEGPLDQAVPIMFRLKFPPNFKVMPHWHPGIEHITIISGTLNMGIGRQVRYLQDARRSRPAACPSCSRRRTTMCGRAKKRSGRCTASVRGP